MKRITSLSFVIIILLNLFSACSKYDDGPLLSLKTKKARLSGTWILKEMKFDDRVQDLTGMTMKLTFKKDGTGLIDIKPDTSSIIKDITWDFSNSKENLKINLKDPYEFYEYVEYEKFILSIFAPSESEILRLTNKELWTKTTDSLEIRDENNNFIDIIAQDKILKYKKE